MGCTVGEPQFDCLEAPRMTFCAIQVPSLPTKEMRPSLRIRANSLCRLSASCCTIKGISLFIPGWFLKQSHSSRGEMFAFWADPWGCGDGQEPAACGLPLWPQAIPRTTAEFKPITSPCSSVEGSLPSSWSTQQFAPVIFTLGSKAILLI